MGYVSASASVPAEIAPRDMPRRNEARKARVGVPVRNAVLRFGSQLTQLARRVGVELDAPGHAAQRLGAPVAPRGLRGERLPALARRRRALPPPARASAAGSLCKLLLQLFERDAFAAADKPALRQMVVLQILDMPQNRLAHVKAFGAAGPLRERRKAFLDIGRQTNGKHAVLHGMHYVHSICGIAALSASDNGMRRENALFPRRKRGYSARPSARLPA
jgi:hypothetical protein